VCAAYLDALEQAGLSAERDLMFPAHFTLEVRRVRPWMRWWRAAPRSTASWPPATSSPWAPCGPLPPRRPGVPHGDVSVVGYDDIPFARLQPSRAHHRVAGRPQRAGRLLVSKLLDGTGDEIRSDGCPPS
jgi:hypothetical protein